MKKLILVFFFISCGVCGCSESSSSNQEQKKEFENNKGFQDSIIRS